MIDSVGQSLLSLVHPHSNVNVYDENMPRYDVSESGFQRICLLRTVPHNVMCIILQPVFITTRHFKASCNRLCVLNDNAQL